MILAAALLAASFGANAGTGAARGLCAEKDTVYFSCKTGKQRWIALCGNVPETLQYRFGREGNVEFKFPQDASEGRKSFLFADYARYQTNRTEVRFSNGGIDYVIFSYMEDGDSQAGVRVTTLDGKEHEFDCAGRVVDRLDELKAVLPCDSDSALTGGNCSP
jgi:hypothetical protein